MSVTLSIVVELENATVASSDRVHELLAALERELGLFSADAADRKAEIICVHGGTDHESLPLRAQLLESSAHLSEFAELKCVALEDGRYYELKNRGVREASGDLVVLVDSDVVPEPDWLAQLLLPFQDPTTMATTGHTYLEHRDLVSRTFALMWVFPLRDQDQQLISRRPLVANNCAFRRKWICDHPFQENAGFKVDCSLMERGLRERGLSVVRTPAKACHAPLSGFRFLAWRGLVTGRDADRKAAIKGSGTGARVRRALTQGLKSQLRTFKRIVTKHHCVSMPVWQVPFSLALGSAFYSLATLGQLMQAGGLTRPHLERIPDFVEAH